MSQLRKQKKQPSRLGSRGSGRPFLLGFYAVVIGAGLLAAANRQNITDWYRLQSYHAPAIVSQLATQTTLTPYAKKVFYVNDPQLDAKQSFVSSCPSGGGEQTIVLGCYHGNQNGIFLLDVSDPRLDGVEQVTAAHEMLHAAYDRLSKHDKESVNKMLLDYYNNDLKDERIRKTIDAYRQTEPTELVNEMHSIFGTEVPNLPSGLEQYYKRYFTTRQEITTFAAKYQAEFTSRHAAVAQMDASLAQLKTQIEATESGLKAKQTQIETRKNALYSMRSSGDINGYNAGVASYNSLVDSYNDDVASLKSMISQYNAIVAQRNTIAAEEGQLANELKSDVTTIQ